LSLSGVVTAFSEDAMLAAWMLYTVVVSLLVGLAALATERALTLVGRPVRWVWAAAAPVALILAVGPWLAGAGGQPDPGMAAAPTGAVSVVEPAAGVLRIPSSIEIPAAGSLARLDRPLAWAWIVLGAGLMLRFGVGSVVLRRRRREWIPTRVGGEEVLLSTDMGPALLGILRNRVVLPRWCLDLPGDSVELVLAHEAEHRRAGDTRLLVPSMASAILLPWNLPFWWMVRRLRQAVEVDCDARVLRRFPDRRRLYGELLLTVCARRASPSGALATFSEHRSTLGRRIQMLSRATEEGSYRRALILGVVGGLLIVVACLVPGPDRDEAGITGPEEELAGADAAGADPAAGSLPEVGAEPQFTPYEIEPQITNAAEVREALHAAYPSLLRDAGIGGSVVVYFFIQEDGSVGNATVNQGSGYPALDAAALRVARQFRFTPAMNRGEPVPVWVSIPVRFEPVEGTAGEAARDAGRVETRSDEERMLRLQGYAGGEEAPRSDGERRPSLREDAAGEGQPSFTPFDIPPEVLNGAEVARVLRSEYPPVLREAGVGGVVAVFFHIGADGGVEDARIAESSGYPALDEAALRTASAFRFSPAFNRGEPVPVWIQIPLRFEVGDNQE